MNRLRNKLRYISIVLLASFGFQLVAPLYSYALTTGPSQPEVQSFEPVDTSEMVDLFTGDYNYNIPLLDVEGYPINLAYHSGTSAEDEASWVGLGWNINPGVINRGMRGLPDDFNGDKVTRTTNIKPNKTWTVGTQLFSSELAGFPIPVGAPTLSLRYNNYRGLGINYTPLSVNFFKGMAKGATPESVLGLTPKVGFSLSLDSQDGLGVDLNLSFSKRLSDSEKKEESSVSYKVGTSFNSRSGLKGMSYGLSYDRTRRTSQTKTIEYTDLNGNKQTATVGVKRTANSSHSSLSGQHSFTALSYSPYSLNNFKNFSVGMSLKVGGAVKFFNQFPLNIHGGYSEQKLDNPYEELPAYGFIYSQNSQVDGRRTLMDFNRESPAPFVSGKSTDLSPVSFTHDIYSVTGQGVGGSYIPYRREVGMVRDAPSTCNNSSVADEISSVSVNGGVDVAFGDIVKGGLNIGLTLVDAYSGPWMDGKGNDLEADHLKFQGNDQDENVFFKASGDALAIETGEKEIFRSHHAHRIGLTENTSNLEKPVKALLDGILTEPRRASRSKRNQPIQFITNKEVVHYGFPTGFWLGGIEAELNHKNVLSVLSDDDILEWTKNRKDDHIAQIIVYKPDGTRYVYGLAAYNNTQVEVTFNVGEVASSDGLVGYEPSTGINSVRNQQGTDNYFQKTETPAYAHSFFLTAILSPDYVDLSNNGVSDDDLGSATKFIYARTSSAFKWRAPMTSGKQANHNPGLIADAEAGYSASERDDKASYVYGEKEIWHLHKIESRNYVAEFELGGGQEDDQRYDNKPANEQNGQIDFGLGWTRYLKSISLFSKKQKIINPTPSPISDQYSSDALARSGDILNILKLPLKKVHFNYDYALCQQTPNSNSTMEKRGEKGKLTLRSIYFTSGNLTNAKLNLYQFDYGKRYATKGDFISGTGEITVNPDFKRNSSDRWGSYKEKASSSVEPANDVYPYSVQDSIQASTNVYAWALTNIDLPSGGKIRLQLESDDYAYVQDKPAMRHFLIRQVTKDIPDGSRTITTEKNALYDFDPRFSDPRAAPPNLYLTFELDEKDRVKTFSIPEGVNHVREKYINNISNNLYFKCRVELNPGVSDYVSGYAEVDKGGNGNCGIIQQVEGPSATRISYGYLKLKSVSLGDNGRGEEVNPITKAAWNFTRLHIPGLIYHAMASSNLTGIEQAAIGIISMFKEVRTLFEGPNRALLRQENGRRLSFKDGHHFSWIRLYDPDGIKYGGGVRVKRVLVDDQWNALSGQGENQIFGQEYDYRKLSSDGQLISSGVASYEPLIGGDENSNKNVRSTSSSSQLLFPDNYFYTESPICESLYPSASVGYSQVVVLPLMPDQPPTPGKKYANIAYNGYTIHQFYTAQDFPVRVEATGLEVVNNSTNKGIGKIVQLLGLFERDHLAASQGFSIILNDMHGKPRGNFNYSGKYNPFVPTKLVSGVEHFYRVEQNNPKILNNQKLPVIYPDGKVEERPFGYDVSAVADMQHQSASVFGAGVGFNLEITSFFPLVIPIFSIFPTGVTSSNTSFRSATVTKVVNVYGIQTKTVAYQEGAKLETENLVWDAETGQVLLTRTQNEFKDWVYSYTTPAHWVYEGMGQAYKNLDLRIESNEDLEKLVPGDVLIHVYKKTEPPVCTTAPSEFSDTSWVLSNESAPSTCSTSRTVTLMNKKGQTLRVCNIEQLSPSNCLPADFIFFSTCSLCLVRTHLYTKVIRSGRRNLAANPVETFVSLVNPLDLDGDDSYMGADNLTIHSPTVSNPAIAKILDASAMEYSDEWKVSCCDVFGDNCVEVGKAFNPYLVGRRSNWRIAKNAKYLTRRQDITSTSDAINPRTSGIYVDFMPYRRCSSGVWSLTNNEQWVANTTVTLYNQYGMELENRDALGNFSSALFGYNNSLPVAVAVNAKHREIAFDGFEDYFKNLAPSTTPANPIDNQLFDPISYKVKQGDCFIRDHFSFKQGFRALYNSPNSKDPALLAKVSITSFESHTGRHSLALENHALPESTSLSMSIARPVIAEADECTKTTTPPHSDGKAVECSDCIGVFTPTIGKPYVFSAWVKVGAYNYYDFRKQVTTYENQIPPITTPVPPTPTPSSFVPPTIEIYRVSNCGKNLLTTCKPSGPVINGWQKLECSFTIGSEPLEPEESGTYPPADTEEGRAFREVRGVLFVLKPASVGDALLTGLPPDNTFTNPQTIHSVLGKTTYYDDVRIFPENGNMKSFVYDPITMRLMADLDNNNYATLYEYDEQGRPIRVKRETERGVFTIQEMRSHQSMEKSGGSRLITP
jgi:hypothetical protein